MRSSWLLLLKVANYNRGEGSCACPYGAPVSCQSRSVPTTWEYADVGNKKYSNGEVIYSIIHGLRDIANLFWHKCTHDRFSQLCSTTTPINIWFFDITARPKQHIDTMKNYEVCMCYILRCVNSELSLADCHVLNAAGLFISYTLGLQSYHGESYPRRYRHHGELYLDSPGHRLESQTEKLTKRIKNEGPSVLPDTIVVHRAHPRVRTQHRTV